MTQQYTVSLKLLQMEAMKDGAFVLRYANEDNTAVLLLKSGSLDDSISIQQGTVTVQLVTKTYSEQCETSLTT